VRAKACISACCAGTRPHGAPTTPPSPASATCPCPSVFPGLSSAHHQSLSAPRHPSFPHSTPAHSHLERSRRRAPPAAPPPPPCGRRKRHGAGGSISAGGEGPVEMGVRRASNSLVSGGGWGAGRWGRTRWFGGEASWVRGGEAGIGRGRERDGPGAACSGFPSKHTSTHAAQIQPALRRC
jgi:hypothetical protein